MKERPELILASTSPRRQEILGRLGRAFRVIPPQADETLPSGVTPSEAACILAERKAESVAAELEAGTVIGADTLAAAGDRIIGKPADPGHAEEILRLLSSRPHAVITGLCLIDAATGRRSIAAESSRVTMRRMSDEEIAAYVASGEPMGKAGAYAIQENGDRYVERIDGSLSNVVGLPLELLERLLARFENEGMDAESA